MEFEELVEKINALSLRKIIFRKVKKISEVHEYGKNRTVPVYEDQPNTVLTRAYLKSMLKYLEDDEKWQRMQQEKDLRYKFLKNKILTVLTQDEFEEFIAANQPY